MTSPIDGPKTLADAMRLFRETKRTCEYYYVISDGKGPSAVAVGATLALPWRVALVIVAVVTLLTDHFTSHLLHALIA